MQILSILCTSIYAATADTYTEDISFRQFRDGNVLAVFNMTTRFAANSDRAQFDATSDYNLVPRSLAQIFKRYNVQEMHLEFTKGRWRDERWGELDHVSPAGVQLWAWMDEKS